MINIRITDIDKPHCVGCGSYCKPDIKGKAINFPYGYLIVCDGCYNLFVIEILRKEKLKLEINKDDSGVS